jgi:hypothetical protein
VNGTVCDLEQDIADRLHPDQTTTRQSQREALVQFKRRQLTQGVSDDEAEGGDHTDRAGESISDNQRHGACTVRVGQQLCAAIGWVR